MLADAVIKSVEFSEPETEVYSRWNFVRVSVLNCELWLFPVL
jgi:hypothetical protein